MGKSIFINITAIFFVISFNNNYAEAVRQDIDINADWKFIKGGKTFEDAGVLFQGDGYENVNIPHTWNTDVLQEKGFYCGLAWYAKELNIASSMKNKRLFLRFEGALDVTTVYVNGKQAGSHAGGYSAFVFEITEYIKCGKDNVLVVSVDNSPNRETIPGSGLLFTRYGGIYRPVWLIVTERACITPLDYAGPGVYIKQHTVTHDVAEIEVLTKVSNYLNAEEIITVRTSIYDSDGRVLEKNSQDCGLTEETYFEVSQSFVLKEPHLWHGKINPYLYKVRVELVGKRKFKDIVYDVVEQPLGLRYFRVDPDEGFFLNGESYEVRGVCRHQDWYGIGSALTPEHHKTDIDMILEIGATAVRLAHYQQANDVYTLCDRSGLLVWAEIPAVAGYDHPKFPNARQQLIELIRQNFNHPSIFFWGIQNESPMQVFDLSALNKTAKKEDPSRLTTMAYLYFMLGPIYGTDLLGINCYQGWYTGSVSELDSNFEYLHKNHPEICLSISEYGAGGCIAHQDQKHEKPKGTGDFFPEQYQSLFHEQYWAIIQQKDYLWGSFIWSMFDFGWAGINRGDHPNMNHKGLVTWDRKTKKDAFYFYKANWSEDPVLHITSKRDLLRTEQQTEVKVYSNCDTVILKVNGSVIGQKDSTEVTNGVFRWQGVNLIIGDNQIELIGHRQGDIYNDTCTWRLMKP